MIFVETPTNPNPNPNPNPGVLLPSYDFFKKLILDSGLLRDNISTHFW